jgi:uncharacterized protein YsxB (DUF464 family)
MVTVSVVRCSSGHIVEFNASGHAKAGPYGNDLVCCAVSVITQAAIIGLQSVVGIALQVNKSSGQLSCQLDMKNSTAKQIEQAQVVLETMFLALRDVAANYGNHLAIYEKQS